VNRRRKDKTLTKRKGSGGDRKTFEVMTST